ncbi:PAS domain-containing protein, partial [Streptomyces sp. NPDC038707]|uniref:PAS domain-containing protein n=1 Tax=Streptomyces sp. NPDC038707 TaxID=3154329 RepID=UPI0033CE57CB
AVVTLVDMPYIVFRAAQQHGDELLRELMLTTHVEEHAGVSGPALLVANDVANVINACVSSALEETVTGGVTMTLDIAFPLETAPAVDTLRHVFEQGYAAAQLGSLLTLPAPPHVRSHYQWVLDHLVTQLSGGPPTAWTLLPGVPDATFVELAPWDAGDVEDSDVPTVAADDGGRIIAANAALADLLGWQTDELIGRPLTVLIPGASARASSCRVHQAPADRPVPHHGPVHPPSGAAPRRQPGPCASARPEPGGGGRPHGTDRPVHAQGDGSRGGPAGITFRARAGGTAACRRGSGAAGRR